MNKERYFNYKKKEYIILNCLEKIKVSTIIDTSDINDIENIDQEKR